jgi:hypothetical protein
MYVYGFFFLHWVTSLTDLENFVALVRRLGTDDVPDLGVSIYLFIYLFCGLFYDVFNNFYRIINRVG